MMKRGFVLIFGIMILSGILSLVSAVPTGLTMNSPGEGSLYGNNITDINWSFSGTINSTTDKCWYQQESNAWTEFNCSSNPVGVPTSIEGNNTWRILINDTSGGSIGEMNNFWVDSISPIINMYNPLIDPAYLSANYFEIVAKLIDSNINYNYANPGKPVKLEIWEPGDISPTITAKLSINSSNDFYYQHKSGGIPILDEGNYFNQITSSDTIGHIVTKTQNITIDRTAPSYSSETNQSDNIYAPLKNYIFSIDWSDSLSGVQNVSIVFDGVSSDVALASGNTYTFTAVDLSAGTHNYTWYATDKAGNLNQTSNLFYEVVQAVPVLDLNSNVGWNVDYLTSTTITGSGCPAQLSCNLFDNNILTANPDTNVLGAGSYTYVYNTTGNTNYTAYTNSSILTINKIASSVSLTFDKTNPIDYGSLLTPTCTRISGETTTSLTQDGVGIVSGITLDLGAGAYAFNCSIAETQNYTTSSDSENFVINQAIPSLSVSLLPSSSIGYGTTTNATGIGCPSQLAGNCNLYRSFLGNDILIASGSDVDILGAGSYTYVYNTTGNTNYSSASSPMTTLTINKASQTAVLNLNPGIAITYGTNINATCNGNLLKDNVIINADNGQNVLLGAGTYAYSCQLAETQNYSYAEDNKTLIVSPASSSIFAYIDNLRSNLSANNSANVWLNSSVQIGEGIGKLYLNDILINYGSGAIGNLTAFNIKGIYNITAIYEATQNYSSSYETFFLNLADSQNPDWKDNRTDASNSIYNGQSVYFNITFDDNNANGTYIFSFYDGSIWINDSVQSWINNQEIKVTKTISGSAGQIVQWYWIFNDSSNNLNQTNIWNFTIAATPASPSSPGGGGGGGGSSCTTTWKCTDWGACINDKQTRTCTKASLLCSAPVKPDESKSCALGIGTGSSNEESESESGSGITGDVISENSEEESSSSGITGNVIGFVASGKGLLTIAFIGLILAGTGAVFYRRKNNLKK